MSGNENMKTWKYSDAFFKDILRQAVPEREEEINDLIKRHAITIVPDINEDALRFSVDLSSHKITVATRPIPRIWGHAFAYVSVYDLMVQMKAADPEVREVTVSNPRFAQAMGVLKWAMRGDAEAKLGQEASALGPQAYPQDLALPFDPHAGDSTHKVARDLALTALSMILLHEIAHLELHHSSCDWPDSVTQERDADAWGASFLLDKCDVYAKKHKHTLENVRRKRLLAIVIGQLWLIHFEVHLGITDSYIHPPAYDRLSSILEQQADNVSDVAWTMAATILCLHYQARYGMTQEGLGFDNSRDCYQFYADFLSRKPKRGF